MMRMDVGMVFLSNEMITLESASTAVTEIVMTRAGSIFAVTAAPNRFPVPVR